MKTLACLLAKGRHQVLFSTVDGTRAYGTNTHESDQDLRGLYAAAAGSYLTPGSAAPADHAARDG